MFGDYQAWDYEWANGLSQSTENEHLWEVQIDGFEAGQAIEWKFTLCPMVDGSASSLALHEEFHWAEESNKRCTKWYEATDSSGIHYQNRKYIVPDPIGASQIVLPIYYFAECDYDEVTNSATPVNKDTDLTDIIGIIATSCVIFCVFALAIIIFARAEHRKAVVAAMENNRLAQNMNQMKEKRESEIHNQHSAEERSLIESELAKIQADDEMNRLFLGMRLDANEIEVKEVIGRGAFGKVSRGSYKGREVAVKEVLRFTQEDLDRFKFECFLSKELRHPHIVQAVGVCWEKNIMALVTDFMPNGSLQGWLDMDVQRRAVNQEDPGNWTWRKHLLKMAVDVADGVAYLHQSHYYDTKEARWKECIIHRDLKPDNFLVTEDMHLKITDFGEARAVSLESNMTVVGTPLFIAPEVMRNDMYDQKVDSYSFAICLYSFLRIRLRLFDLFTSSLRKTMKKKSARGIGPGIVAHRIDTGWRPEIPQRVYPALVKLIEDCWDGDPARRPNFAEIVDVLRSDVTEEVYTLPEPLFPQEEMLPEGAQGSRGATKEGETREAEARTD